MKLSESSYAARVNHEGLYEYNISFGLENAAIETLKLLKEYNKNKNVLHICCKLSDLEDENVSPRYKNTVWRFAYETEEELKGAQKVFEEAGWSWSNCYGRLSEEVSCPLSDVV